MRWENAEGCVISSVRSVTWLAWVSDFYHAALAGKRRILFSRLLRLVVSVCCENEPVCCCLCYARIRMAPDGKRTRLRYFFQAKACCRVLVEPMFDRLDFRFEAEPCFQA